MKAIIMAGGKGTRISSVAINVPKPMLKINEMPVLEHAIANLRSQGFTDVIITVSHLKNTIIDYFGDGSKISPVTHQTFGINISYYIEDQPHGNAGALFKLRKQLGNSPFLLLNADIIFDVNFKRMFAFHTMHNALITLFTHPNSHPYDSGLIVAEKNGVVNSLLLKEDPRPIYYKNCVNAGIHIINPEALDLINVRTKEIGASDENGQIIKVDLDRQILKPLISTGRIFCYNSPEYVKDMGTPERFRKVEGDFKAGRISSKCLSYKQRAIFLDRDGTINKYKEFLKNINDFELLPGVTEAIRKINNSGYLVIVITNQPVIARGEVSWSELNNIHNKMETLLGLDGAYIDGLYFCPHHPNKGYPGEIPELKFDCNCRKPKPGMLLKASKDFNIDLEKSYMVGDSINDIKAGKNAGCKTVLINNNAFYGQDISTSNLKTFVDNYLMKE